LTDGGVRMVLLSPAVQMPAAVAASRSRLSASPQYINAATAAAAMQPAVQSISGYRWPQSTTYVT